jgi:hypothetical protein
MRSCDGPRQLSLMVNSRRADLVEMKAQEEAMVFRHATAKGLADALVGGLRASGEAERPLPKPLAQNASRWLSR